MKKISITLIINKLLLIILIYVIVSHLVDNQKCEFLKSRNRMVEIVRRQWPRPVYFRYHGASSRVLRVSARHAGNYRILIFARRVGRIFLCGCGQPMPRYCVSNGHQRSFDTRLISFWDNYFLYLSHLFLIGEFSLI